MSNTIGQTFILQTLGASSQVGQTPSQGSQPQSEPTSFTPASWSQGDSVQFSQDLDEEDSPTPVLSEQQAESPAPAPQTSEQAPAAAETKSAPRDRSSMTLEERIWALSHNADGTSWANGKGEVPVTQYLNVGHLSPYRN